MNTLLVREPHTVGLTAGTADPEEWDDFLKSLPDGHHLQTSLWAELKRPVGWEASRLVLRQDGKLVAGLQILHRAVFKLGRVGYVPRGPVFAHESSQLPGRLMQELRDFVRSRGLWYVAVQPPRYGSQFAPELVSSGFRATPLQAAPTATVLIDVQQPDDKLLASMRSNTRRGVRVGLKAPLKVRVGTTTADVARFHAVLVATGQRRGFSPPSLDYFCRMWELFSRKENIALFLVELGEEVVAGELDVAFGDTLVSKRAGWSGAHRDLHPNELLVWTALRWARERGLKYYDMEGVDPELAEVLSEGTEVPTALKQSHHGFKMSFGGSLVVLPDNYEYVRLPVLGWLHRDIWCGRLSVKQRRRLLKKIGLL